MLVIRGPGTTTPGQLAEVPSSVTPTVQEKKKDETYPTVDGMLFRYYPVRARTQSYICTSEPARKAYLKL